MDEWSRKFLEFMNVLLQMSQTNGLTSLCWLTWYLSWWLCLNALPHSAQINGLVSSSSSLLSRAIFSCVRVQNLHTNSFISLVNERVDICLRTNTQFQRNATCLVLRKPNHHVCTATLFVTLFCQKPVPI